MTNASVRAVVAKAWGGPEGIDLVDVESRPPGPGEVVIAVRATGLSPFDLKRAQGIVRLGDATPPLRLGNEAAGVVAEVGSGAVGFDGRSLVVGDEVFGHWLEGAQASRLTVPASMLLLKPASLGFAEAAGLLGSGTTAVHALEAARVEAGDLVLVHGASGAVGGMVAQLAILRGARVIGTAAPQRHARLRELGLEPVAYGPGLEDRVRALVPGGVSAAIDTAGTDEALGVSAVLVTEPRRIVSIAAYQSVLAVGGQALGPGPETERIRIAARSELTRLAVAGRLRVEIATTFPLARARAAYELLATGHAGGKVLLTVEAAYSTN